jgi:hypothetical protein
MFLSFIAVCMTRFVCHWHSNLNTWITFVHLHSVGNLHNDNDILKVFKKKPIKTPLGSLRNLAFIKSNLTDWDLPNNFKISSISVANTLTF